MGLYILISAILYLFDAFRLKLLTLVNVAATKYILASIAMTLASLKYCRTTDGILLPHSNNLVCMCVCVCVCVRAEKRRDGMRRERIKELLLDIGCFQLMHR